jgi:SAM-dependent methyltransferase
VRRSSLLRRVQDFLYKGKSYRAKFRAYYLDNGWQHPETFSGPGSTLAATEIVRNRLLEVFKEFGIRSVIDVPCGDFNWMKKVDLDGISYHGLDIVKELVDSNSAKYGRDDIRFSCVDMITDDIPKADLVICRDCLFHYTSRLIIKSLANLKRSGSEYLLTTSFPGIDRNQEIETIGLYRPINLQLPPFALPTPLLVIHEGGSGSQSLCLWRLRDIPVGGA